MGIFHHVPPVFTGGAQPFGHVEATPPSNPPPPFVPVAAAAILAAVLSAWTSPDPAPALPPKLAPPTSASLAWSPSPPSETVMQTVAAAWAPSDPLPVLQARTAASPGWSVDGPPRIAQRQFPWTDDPPTPQLGRKLVPIAIAVSNPPGYSTAWLPSLLIDWWRVDPTFQWRVNFTPSGAAIVPVPPPFRRLDLSATLAAWLPPDPLPQLPRRLVGAPGWSVDNPPPRSGAVVPWPADSPITPVVSTRLAQGFVSTAWTFSPAAIAAEIVSAWQADPPQPVQNRSRAPIPAAVVNNPPPRSIGGLAGILVEWWRTDQPFQWKAVYTPSGGTAQPIANPRYTVHGVETGYVVRGVETGYLVKKS